jgi:hypothetical protein
MLAIFRDKKAARTLYESNRTGLAGPGGIFGRKERIGSMQSIQSIPSSEGRFQGLAALGGAKDLEGRPRLDSNQSDLKNLKEMLGQPNEEQDLIFDQEGPGDYLNGQFSPHDFANDNFQNINQLQDSRAAGHSRNHGTVLGPGGNVLPSG